MNANRTSGCEHPCKSAGRMFFEFSCKFKKHPGRIALRRRGNYVAEATRRRRRILQAGFFYRISNLTSKKFKKLVIEIMTHFAYDNFNILMRQYIKNLIVRIKQAIWLIDMSFLSDHMRGDSYYEYSEQYNYKTCRDSSYGCVMLCIFYIPAD